MPYITVMQTVKTRQISLEEILNGEIDMSAFQYGPSKRIITGTVTRYVEKTPEELMRKIDADRLTALLEVFALKHASLYEKDRSSLYRQFFIPKKTGGLRKINAPCDELSDALIELKTMFETDFCSLYHTSAYAYVKGRSTVDMVRKHQANGSKWFAKLDFSNFFGSTTEPFLFSMISMIFPFSEVCKTDRGRSAMHKALDLCFLDGGLPQGTPISPMLTNLMMIPIDHRIANDIHDKRMVYTRYADDTCISSEYTFSCQEIVDYMHGVLEKFNAPFRINSKKTRYGSSSGSNWCLGLMLNGQNQITIGWKNVQRFKAMCNSYIQDNLHGIKWDIGDVMSFRGIMSYYRMIEEEYIDYIIKHYNDKYNVNMMAMIKRDLSGNG